MSDDWKQFIDKQAADKEERYFEAWKENEAAAADAIRKSKETIRSMLEAVNNGRREASAREQADWIDLYDLRCGVCGNASAGPRQLIKEFATTSHWSNAPVPNSSFEYLIQYDVPGDLGPCHYCSRVAHDADGSNCLYRGICRICAEAQRAGQHLTEKEIPSRYELPDDEAGRSSSLDTWSVTYRSTMYSWPELGLANSKEARRAARKWRKERRLSKSAVANLIRQAQPPTAQKEILTAAFDIRL